MNDPLSVQWGREWLLPGLSRGTTIVLDSRSVHRDPRVRATVEAAGCQLVFLPAYSPDFNPIEQVFTQLKTYRRGAAARTLGTLVEAIGAGSATVTSAHIRAYGHRCGYPLPDPDSQPT